VRVLIVSQHYAPEVTAAVARVQAFAEGLAARGHEVEVVCAKPNHPRGIVAEGYRGWRTVNGELNGVGIRYVWTRVRPDKTTVNRLLAYASFAASAVIAGSRSPRPDVVLASSPPLPVGASAAAIARRHGAPWVLDVRDIWPEAAVVLGELRGARAIREAERLERSLYRGAAAIVTVTEPFREQIAAVGGDAGKLTVIPNGTTPLWLDAGAAEPDRAAAGLPDGEFVWGYGGNIGIGQGMETAVEAAALLGKGFRLLIVGAGPRLQAVKALAAEREAARIEFRPLMEPAAAAVVLRACDALLVPLAAEPALEKFVPSKLFDCCALGRPVLVAAAGESQRLVAEWDAGVPVPPGDARALAEAVRALCDDPERARELSEGARRFAAENMRERGVERLERVLAAVGPQSGAG
jgi:glycosyltransferase involved in cell wall biosynthesis